MVPFNAYVLLKLFEGTLTERHVCSDLRQSNNTLPDCPSPSLLPTSFLPPFLTPQPSNLSSILSCLNLDNHSSTRTSWRHFRPGTSLEDPLHSSHCRWRDSVFVTLGHRCHSGSPASDLWRFLHLHHSSPARHDTEAGFLHSSY